MHGSLKVLQHHLRLSQVQYLDVIRNYYYCYDVVVIVIAIEDVELVVEVDLVKVTGIVGEVVKASVVVAVVDYVANVTVAAVVAAAVASVEVVIDAVIGYVEEWVEKNLEKK